MEGNRAEDRGLPQACDSKYEVSPLLSPGSRGRRLRCGGVGGTGVQGVCWQKLGGEWWSLRIWSPASASSPGPLHCKRGRKNHSIDYNMDGAPGAARNPAYEDKHSVSVPHFLSLDQLQIQLEGVVPDRL